MKGEQRWRIRGNGRDTHGSVKLWGQELKPTTRVRVERDRSASRRKEEPVGLN